MEIKEIFLKIFKQLKESDHSKFKKQSSEFYNILNFPIEAISTMIDNILTPIKPITKGVTESNLENLDNKGQTLLPPHPGKNSQESLFPKHQSPENLQGNDEILKGKQGDRNPSSLSKTTKKPSVGRNIPKNVDPTLPPTPFPKGNVEQVDISKEKKVVETKPTIIKYSGKTKEFFDWAEKELKNHYSGSNHIASVPCQICRYYCRECEMKGFVINNYSCMATCKLEYFKLGGDLSCSKFTLWQKNEYLEKKLSEISKDFFRGYMLILCHNHRTAFTQGKIIDIKEKIRNQLYQKCSDEEYLKDLGHSVIIEIDGLLNMEGESIPIGIYISKEHLKYFKSTYDKML